MDNSESLKRHIMYLKMAEIWAGNSHSTRKQVGAIIVKDNMIISDGYNGTPRGFINNCEDSCGDTHWYVLHAESNAITKLAKSTQSGEGAILYITLSPCRECCKLIIQTGISKVIYKDEYRDITGLRLLKQAGIPTLKINY